MVIVPVASVLYLLTVALHFILHSNLLLCTSIFFFNFLVQFYSCLYIVSVSVFIKVRKCCPDGN